MLSVLANRAYRHLFLAQIVALIGTGLATVALGLVAYDLAGERGGAVLGTALAIKMVAYVLAAPVAGALAEVLPRRRLLVALDLVRAGTACFLPFVTEVWQIYVLIFFLQTASGSFTPIFQATIPDVLPEEKDYTRALSLSRLAYDLENLLSPTLAGLLLLVVSAGGLFFGTAIGFVASAALVVSVVLPGRRQDRVAPFRERVSKGARIYLATPRLRALLALSLAVSAVGAMVIVNTVVLVQSGLGLGEGEVALALAGFGGGSIVAALLLPRVLDRVPDRPVMLLAATGLPAGLLIFPLIHGLTGLVLLWAVLGLFYATVQMPSGRPLKRSAHGADRPAVYAAHFALSHAMWLVSYPLAGWLGVELGLPVTALVLAGVAAVAALVAWRVWPEEATDGLVHTHDDLPTDHPHWQEGEHVDGGHRHVYIVDPLHRRWPA
ncbi:putative NreB protein [Parvularcula bermudensis HTCC2503]|uniref:Putative NreB protein n=1 Tax=Parvularcula bermudensis (strain ATCC BAA-594 / HTCC2503 / KCTC 12087) TaxID=314260 RepID=E0TI12_PARBH|nr:MFS transporter [Parvularcula bermudensis]ADM10823.1 putative NreB protein [Parvularcula bermudensis HTCC2503]